MSHRQEDEPLIPWLRSLQDRIDRLEKGDKGIRQNDIRLGDMLVTTNADSNQVCLNNLVTGETTCIGGSVPLAGWSFSGPLGLITTDLDLNYSPPYVMTEARSAVRIVMATRKVFTGDVTVCINFDDGRVQKSVTLSGRTLMSQNINVPLSIYDKITVRTVSAGVGCKNLSVFVWFGDPVVGITKSDC